MVERKPSTLKKPEVRKSSRSPSETLPPISRKQSKFSETIKPTSKRTTQLDEISQPKSRDSGFIVQEPKVIISMGEELEKRDLHTDPFGVAEAELENEKKRKERKKREEDGLMYREQLRTDIIEQTKNRMKYTIGPKATDEEVDYCTQPCLQLIREQSKLVEESRNEIDVLSKILETKQLDIAKLSMENDKFLSLSRGKTEWREYEMLLAKERIVNRRLMSMLAEKSNEQILKEGRKNTYQEWIDQKAQVGTGEHSGIVFPRRRLSPKY